MKQRDFTSARAKEALLPDKGKYCGEGVVDQDSVLRNLYKEVKRFIKSVGGFYSPNFFSYSFLNLQVSQR